MSDSPGWFTRAAVWQQNWLPQHGLTAMANRISQSRQPWLYRPLMRGFCRLFPVQLDESMHPLDDFGSFDEFFTRALKPGLRTYPDQPEQIASPSDGTLSQLGTIVDGRIIQAKGHTFSASEIIGDEGLAKPFKSGHFATIYLAPHDYHRVHMPFAGQLTHEIRIPGTLFSVSDTTSQIIPGLYARNERMVALFETSSGPLAVIMVAAMMVAGIETTWAPNDPLRPEKTIQFKSIDRTVHLDRGDELGRFHWGSTVVVLTGPDFAPWLPELKAGQPMRLGQALNEPNR